MVLGLAQSNAKAENTLFTARHSLVACELSIIISDGVLNIKLTWQGVGSFDIPSTKGLRSHYCKPCMQGLVGIWIR